ncbi:DUF5665 domain-containing protein [Metallumcola ferriviriculae]|uniref:DUF5665 domain-containing protein n=1 Tax=Metallumcola ferriviriculae TaxID=3039180 RepID=A0AAU0UNU9_9FIRM|nr:DUF5665 domain-containing protein [Desulfitibacteraceae bacterium MK1]
MSEKDELLAEQLEKLVLYFEKMRLAQYVELLQNPWRLAYVNFLAGLARGLGYGLGITVLLGLVVFLLRQVVMLNLPIISDFIAQIVRMVIQRY